MLGFWLKNATSSIVTCSSCCPARDFELSMVGQNLFEPHHPEFTGDPAGFVEIRRSFFAKVTWTRE
jgi:hypothetical protein